MRPAEPSLALPLAARGGSEPQSVTGLARNKSACVYTPTDRDIFFWEKCQHAAADFEALPSWVQSIEFWGCFGFKVVL